MLGSIASTLLRASVSQSDLKPVGQHDAALAHHEQLRDAPHGLPEFAQDPPGSYSQFAAPYGTAGRLRCEFSESRS